MGEKGVGADAGGVAFEWLELASHRSNGQVEAQRLAQCHVHGEWMQWLRP